MHLASASGKLVLVQCMLGRRADVNLLNAEGRSALDIAALSANFDLEDSLREAGRCSPCISM